MFLREGEQHTRTVQTLDRFFSPLPPLSYGKAWVEFSTYLLQSFGDPGRIDYGTGHELNFLCALYCLEVGCGYFSKAERNEYMLTLFRR